MNRIDFAPLYRNSIGFDHLFNMLDAATKTDAGSGYPPYNIEALDENQYSIALAVAGFRREELDLQVHENVLTVKGKKEGEESRKYLHQGIAYRSFERKFNLADHVEVTGADLQDGLLTISLKKEIPEAAKPRQISIGGTQAVASQKVDGEVLEQQTSSAA